MTQTPSIHREWATERLLCTAEHRSKRSTYPTNQPGDLDRGQPGGERFRKSIQYRARRKLHDASDDYQLDLAIRKVHELVSGFCSGILYGDEVRDRSGTQSAFALMHSQDRTRRGSRLSVERVGRNTNLAMRKAYLVQEVAIRC